MDLAQVIPHDPVDGCRDFALVHKGRFILQPPEVHPAGAIGRQHIGDIGIGPQPQRVAQTIDEQRRVKHPQHQNIRCRRVHQDKGIGARAPDIRRARRQLACRAFQKGPIGLPTGQKQMTQPTIGFHVPRVEIDPDLELLDELARGQVTAACQGTFGRSDKGRADLTRVDPIQKLGGALDMGGKAGFGLAGAHDLPRVFLPSRAHIDVGQREDHRDIGLVRILAEDRFELMHACIHDFRVGCFAVAEGVAGHHDDVGPGPKGNQRRIGCAAQGFIAVLIRF